MIALIGGVLSAIGLGLLITQSINKSLKQIIEGLNDGAEQVDELHFNQPAGLNAALEVAPAGEASKGFAVCDFRSIYPSFRRNRNP
jgi:hypothetical protein